MDKTGKILVTVIIITVFFILFAIVVGLQESSGSSTPGIMGLILFGALYGGIRGIWKRNKSDDSDSSMLQK